MSSPDYGIACRDTMMGLLAYFSMGIDPGSFGHAILLKDFDLAKKHAHPLLTDEDIERFIAVAENDMPTICIGDEESIKQWIKWGGAKGLRDSGEMELLMAVKLEIV